jgi:rubrerythrin
MMDQSIRVCVEALNLMAESEKMVAEFYLLCSETFTEHHAFWAALAREEMAHARVVGKLIELVSIQPNEFASGKSTPINAIKLFIKKTQSNIGTLKQSDVSMEKALLMAYHIENTIIEQKYADVVSTENEAFRTLLNQVITDTLKHKEKVVARIKQLREGSKPPKSPS